MKAKKQQLEPDIEQRTGSKLGKEYARAVYCHPAYLTSLQSISCEMPACASSSPAFLMMYSAYKLNKHGGNIQP